MKTYPEIDAVILSGGRARRMGGEDKGLLPLAGRPLLEHVLQRLRPQVERITISANHNLERYRIFGCPVVSDLHGGYRGPLAGIATLLERGGSPLLLAVPCDAPLLPVDLAPRLYEALRDSDAPCSVAHDGESLQPLFALFRAEAGAALCSYLENGHGKTRHWHRQHGSLAVDYSDMPDAFLNINTPAELQALERRLSEERR